MLHQSVNGEARIGSGRRWALAIVAVACAGAAPPAAAGFLGDFEKALRSGREMRCATAICWGEERRYGLEPLADLPVGKMFSYDGWGSLSKFENSHDLTASFVAGVRFWAFHDLASLSVYLSKPLYDGSATIRLQGSPFQYSAGNIRRPYPGVALGLLGDSLWIGVDYDQLRNGDGDTNRDLNYPRGQVVSSTFTFTVAILPVTLARNGLGALTEASKKAAAEKAERDAAAARARVSADADAARADAAIAKAEADAATARAEAAAKIAAAKDAAAKVTAKPQATDGTKDQAAKPETEKQGPKTDEGTNPRSEKAAATTDEGTKRQSGKAGATADPGPKSEVKKP